MDHIETPRERWIEFLRQVDTANDKSIVSIRVSSPDGPVRSIQMSLWELFEIIIGVQKSRNKK